MNLTDYIKNGFLEVTVKPGSRKTEIIGYDESRGVLRVAVAAQAENNKANKELLSFIKKQTGLEAEIKSGYTSKRKLIRLRVE